MGRMVWWMRVCGPQPAQLFALLQLVLVALQEIGILLLQKANAPSHQTMLHWDMKLGGRDELLQLQFPCCSEVF